MKTSSQAYNQMMKEAKLSFTDKAKKGQMIQSFDVTMPVDYSRGSLIGKVTKVATDPLDGVEYVYFKPVARIVGGVAESLMGAESKEFKVPQNGTPTTTGKKTDGINVIK